MREETDRENIMCMKGRERQRKYDVSERMREPEKYDVSEGERRTERALI